MADVQGNTQQIHGTRATGVADGDNPVKIGGVGRTQNPLAVSDGNRVDAYCDDLGRIVVMPYVPRDLVVHNQITLTTTTETTLIAAASGTFHDLVWLAASNTSGTAVRLDIKDSNTGTVRFSMMLAANGGGFTQSFPAPLTQAAANNNWRAELSAAVTDVRVMALAVKSP